MSTPFLLNFSRKLVRRLIADGQLEVRDEPAVVSFLAAALAGEGRHQQAISATSAALLACPDVEELYVDDEQLKEVIGDLSG